MIFLDVNRFTCIYRAIKRTLTSKSRPDMADGCEERFDLEFIKFLWGYPNKIRPTVMKKLCAVMNCKNVIIATSGENALQQCEVLYQQKKHL